MMRTASAVCQANPGLNRDLLLAGCLFHDCGKLWENCYPKEDFTMPYSEAGELLGHIPLGIELVNNLWKRIMSLPEADSWKTLDPPSPDVRMHLLHLIASHHGELAFGSPVFPKTPEAVALHYIDNLDAKLEMFRGAYETARPWLPECSSARPLCLPTLFFRCLPSSRWSRTAKTLCRKVPPAWKRFGVFFVRGRNG